MNAVNVHGWWQKTAYLPAFRENAIREAFKYFGLNPTSSVSGPNKPNHMTAMAHLGRRPDPKKGEYRKSYSVGNVPYVSTEAEYIQAATPKRGQLVLQTSEPLHQAIALMPEAARPANLPPVGEWKDLGLLLWKKACATVGVRLDILEYVFVIGIDDSETVAIAAAARDSVSFDATVLHAWPCPTRDTSYAAKNSRNGVRVVTR